MEDSQEKLSNEKIINQAYEAYRQKNVTYDDFNDSGLKKAFKEGYLLGQKDNQKIEERIKELEASIINVAPSIEKNTREKVIEELEDLIWQE